MSADRAALAHLRHELRTPLNHIIGYSEMLLEDVADEDPAALGTGLRRVGEDARCLLGVIDAGVRADAAHFDREALSAELAEPMRSLSAVVAELQLGAARVGAKDAEQDLDRVAAAAGALRELVANGFQTQRDALPAAAGAPEPAAAARAEGGAILIVDDSSANREMLGRRLEREGHRVQRAAGGSEALALLRQQPADLVLLDVRMPDMDGYEVLRQLKADAELRDVPVLMISALDEIESVVRCIELGAEDYLPTPFDPVLLRARIGACLEKKRLRDREVVHLRELEVWGRTLEQRVAEQVALVERLGRLKRFFSPQLAELVVAGGADDPLKTHRREITVCFLDLRGFTAFAETAEPEEVMGVLREYHAGMGELILEHEGTLERFTGDGMMVFFNDPVPVPDAGVRAVKMALAMRECVAGLVAGWHKQGYQLEMGIGIAQGYATIGAIGFEGRWDYGAIGSVTNLGARLCSEAKGGQILISKRVLATADGLLEVEPAGELSLAGFQRPVAAFQVLGLKA